MKFTAAALAASLFAPALVAGAPRVVKVDPSDIKPRNIGGSRIKLPQIYNTHFKQHAKGPRALAKVCRKYNIEMPPELVEVLKGILQDLGIDLPTGKVGGFHAHDSGKPYTNETDDQGALIASYCIAQGNSTC
jgi:hypothetical protein